MSKAIDILKKFGYREDLDCKDISVLLLEKDLSKGGKIILDNLNVNYSPYMKLANENDYFKMHSTQTSGFYKTFLRNSKVSLFPNDSSGYAEWYYNNYQIVSASVSGVNTLDSNIEKMSKKSYMLASAGNQDVKGTYETRKWFDLVGALDENYKLRNYSSYDTNIEVDFVSIDGYEFMDEKLYGTSYSILIDGVLTAQLEQLFYNKYKIYPTPKQVSHIKRRCCKDVDIEGIDNKTGYGIFILPSDDELEFFPYIGKIIDYRIGIYDMLDCISTNEDKSSIVVKDYKINLSKNSFVNSSLLSYFVRQKMSELKIDIENIVINTKTINPVKFKKYITNPTIFTLEIENGHK